MKILRKVYWKISWLFGNLFWIPFHWFVSPKHSNKVGLSIGITTFMDRYNSTFKNLLKKIILLFPEDQIIVVANGHVKEKEQEQYLAEIKNFCATYSNVELVTYLKPKGLSFIWNRIVDSSVENKVLIINDDLDLNPVFKWFLLKCGILDSEIATIQNSWSHFLISKKIFDQIGRFDEGLLEIGGEDDDYCARLAMHNINLNNYNTSSIRPSLKVKEKRLKVNSYGKNMNEERFGYSSLNSKYLESKWFMSDVYFEGAIKVPNRRLNYWKLKCPNNLYYKK